MKLSRMQKVAVGATLVGVAVVGARAISKRRKVKALLAKGTRKVRSKVGVARG